MTSKTISFIGRGRDQFGMPTPYYSYLLIESNQPHMGNQYYIASIVPLTEPAPMPAQRHFISDKGPATAMTIAVEALKSHEQMRALPVQES